ALSLGFIASLSDADDFNGFALSAGYLDGQLVASDETAASPKGDGGQVAVLHRIVFAAECSLRQDRTGIERDDSWSGVIRFYGQLRIGNAIRWPTIDKSDVTDDITWPNDPKPRSGRTTVTVLDSSFFCHSVTYTLDGHELPFDLATRIKNLQEDAVWTVPVV